MILFYFLNAFTLNEKMFIEISQALQEADLNPSIICCAITGNGPYFSSGNDLTNYTSNADGEPKALIKAGCNLCLYFIYKVFSQIF